MKIIFLLISSFLFISTCFSQQDLLPIFPNEINYQGERAYFEGIPFTGLLVDKNNTNLKWGMFRNGYKIGLFTEYFSNGQKKYEGNFVNGVKEGLHTEWYETGQKARVLNCKNGELIGKLIEWNIDGSVKAEIDLSVNDFKSNYYLGSMYYNKGVEQIEAANKIPENQPIRYEEENNKADVWFSKTLPYMEKCYELNDKDVPTLETLKNLYYRMKNMYKFKEMDEKIKKQLILNNNFPDEHISSDMNQNINKNTGEVYFIVDEMPEFPGGELALRNFVDSSISYPEKAKEKKMQGKIYITFIVNIDGSISDSRVARGIDPILNEEALRIVKTFPKWKPGKQKGNPVRVSYTIPINFIL